MQNEITEEQMMNKYQEFLLKGYLGQNFIFKRCCPLGCELDVSKTHYGKYDKETDTFILTQDENNPIDIYTILIEPSKNTLNQIIDNVSVLAKAGWEKVELKPFGINKVLAYEILINFNNRTEKIKLSFKNGLADDYILDLKYIEADKEKYLAKKAQQKKADLLKTANIKHSTGNDLVNIYFQPCCDEYERTEIILYKDSQMLAKYKVDDGVFFKSINGLAYGTYEYIVKQFGKNNNLLLETDKIKFTICAPYYGGDIFQVVG